MKPIPVGNFGLKADKPRVASIPQPDIYSRKIVNVLTPKVKEMVGNHYTLESFKMTGCTREDNFTDHAAIGDYPMQRCSVFKTFTQLGTYNHHASLVRWKDRYWLARSNCMVNEGGGWAERFYCSFR